MMFTEKYIKTLPQVERYNYTTDIDCNGWEVVRPLPPLRFSPAEFSFPPDVLTGTYPGDLIGQTVTMTLWGYALKGVITQVQIERSCFSYGTNEVRITVRPTGAPIYNTREDKMKVYEAIVVRVNAEKVVEEVVKHVTPFAAPDAQAARDQVLFDYAQDKGLTGKELTVYAVRTREFQNSANSYI